MKSRAKNLGLTGLILGASIFSGCKGLNDNSLLGMGLSAVGVHKNNPLAQVVGGQLSNYGAAQAGASQTNVYVNGGRPVGAPRAETFVCEKMVDFNNDGFIDPKTEAVGRGRAIFYADETITYAVYQEGCRGRRLNLYGQESPDSPMMNFMTILIQQDSSTPQTPPISLFDTKPGIYNIYWTLDGMKIGEHIIQVKQR